MGGGGDTKLETQATGPLTVAEMFDQAKSRAFRGGLTGAAAQGVNVLSLMWLRTTMNYQMANGTKMIPTIKLLFKEGGVSRFYRGLIPALVQSPVSRFGDTFANAGALAFLNSSELTQQLPIAVKTACASLCAGGVRIFLMPIDAWKTNKQVHGKAGLTSLLQKVRNYPNRSILNLYGWSSLWHGGIAAASATAVGHWPWFVVYNYLDAYLPWNEGTAMQQVSRNAGIGLAASFVSDVSSNGIRVLKTYRQTYKEPVSYFKAFNDIRLQHGLFGWEGLFFRGLQTRIVSHGINSMVFTVAWKYFQQLSGDKH